MSRDNFGQLSLNNLSSSIKITFYFNSYQSDLFILLITANMSQTVHCHISDLLQIDYITSSSNDLFLNYTASIHDLSLDMNEKSISVKLTYYNRLHEEFSNDVVMFCFDALIVVKSSDSYSELSIRTHFLIRFVTLVVFVFDHLTNLYQMFRRFWKEHLYWWDFFNAFFHTWFLWCCYISSSEEEYECSHVWNQSLHIQEET